MARKIANYYFVEAIRNKVFTVSFIVLPIQNELQNGCWYRWPNGPRRHGTALARLGTALSGTTLISTTD
jgi:hypothetical protein